jgi:hypothetical protein
LANLVKERGCLTLNNGWFRFGPVSIEAIELLEIEEIPSRENLAETVSNLLLKVEEAWLIYLGESLLNCRSRCCS